MTEFSTLIQQGATSAWLFVPSAILLGALHGLEPGHSKTMMAAFIVAIRGTLMQAVLLGLAATVSHTAIVWVVALAGMYFGGNLNSEVNEPYFQVASAVLIIGIAWWMLFRTRRQIAMIHGDHRHSHNETKSIDTESGVLSLEIFEDGIPPHFRLRSEDMHKLTFSPEQVNIETERKNGERQVFTFVLRNDFLESEQEIPEPHEFTARLSLGHGDHRHCYDLEYVEHVHNHDSHHAPLAEFGTKESLDSHEMAHANDIRRRFANRNVTTGQIVIFGLTGGLIPCPASITVLLLCLQLKQIMLGVVLVLCFGIGLALTMVVSGAVAALGMKHISRRWSGFDNFIRKTPYFASSLIMLIGIYIGYQGLRALM